MRTERATRATQAIQIAAISPILIPRDDCGVDWVGTRVGIEVDDVVDELVGCVRTEDEGGELERTNVSVSVIV